MVKIYYILNNTKTDLGDFDTAKEGIKTIPKDVLNNQKATITFEYLK